eukprot:gene20144-33993_t
MARETSARVHADAAAAAATAEVVKLRAQLEQRDAAHAKLRAETAVLKRTLQSIEFARDCAETKNKAVEKTLAETRAALGSATVRLGTLAKVDMAVAAAGVDLDNLNGETVLAAVKGLTSEELLKVMDSALGSVDIDLGAILDTFSTDSNSPKEVVAELLENGALKSAAFSVIGSGILGEKLQSMGEDGTLTRLIESIATPEA